MHCISRSNVAGCGLGLVQNRPHHLNIFISACHHFTLQVHHTILMPWLGLLLVSRLLVEESNSFSEWGCDGFFPRSHFMLTVFCCVRGKCMLRVSTTEFCKPHRSKGALLIYIDRGRGREREREREAHIK